MPSEVDTALRDPIPAGFDRSRSMGGSRSITAAAVRDRAEILAICLTFGLIGAAVAAWAGRPWPALTPDSTMYVNAAENLRRGIGLVSTITPIESHAASAPFASWPPVFPLLIAALLPFATNPIAAIKVIELAATALAAFPIGYLAHRIAGRRMIVPVLGFWAILRPHALVASFAWSEPLFILWTYASIALLVHAMGRPRGNGLSALLPYAAAGGMAGLAMLTRYIGFVVIATGIVALSTRGAEEDESGRRTLAKLGAFLIPASIPNLAWILRNQMLTGHLFGESRGASIADPQGVILSTLRTFWIDIAMPHLASNEPARAAFAAVSFVCFLVLIGGWISHFGPELFIGSRERGNAAHVLTVFSILYSILMIGLSIRIAYDPINSRFLAPVYPSILLLGAMPFRLFQGRRLFVATAAAIVLLWIHIAATVGYAEGAREDRSLTGPYWRSVVFGDPRWERDPAVAGTLAASSPGNLVLSNIPDVLAIWTDRAVKSVPLRGTAGFEDAIGAHRGSIVLIHPQYRRLFVGVEEMDRMVAEGRCVPLGIYGGGHLYRVVR